MKAKHIDLTNTFLILLSFGLAYYLPFELFLFAYAVLGPLHYLTEISWIQDKNYFIPEKRNQWKWLIVAFSFFYSLPYIFKLKAFEPYYDISLIKFMAFRLSEYTNSLVFLTLCLAIVLIAFKENIYRFLGLVVALVFAVFMQGNQWYMIFLGGFLPTLVHVYLFTILFMMYGNIKNGSNIGTTNIILMLLVPVGLVFLSVPNSYNISPNTEVVYSASTFDGLVYVIKSKIFAVTDGKFLFRGVLENKIQMFIAFAYTYHYLNWFSKTTIIGWHKRLTQKKSIIFALIWMGAVALYFINYRTGLSLLVFLSIMHVLLEFPLNVVTFKEIGKYLQTKLTKN